MSLSIGQGELMLTPLQIANVACVIANRGYYMTPHIVRPLEGMNNKVKKQIINCNPENFDVIIEGMSMAGNSGTARGAALDSIEICGKTGTAQNPHGEDHSIFMVFAPKDNPKIAMAVYIENGGFGAQYAVPIAGLLLEKYLKGSISPNRRAIERKMMESNLLPPIKEVRTKPGTTNSNQED